MFVYANLSVNSELESVTEVDALAKLGFAALAPGLWRIALPFPSPMGYSFSYLQRIDDGFLAVDLGWDTDAGWELFEAGVRRAGGSVEDVVGVVVTHAHPDHYGLVSVCARRRLRSALGETGAHLVHLANAGRLTRDSGSPIRWYRTRAEVGD